jgi:hypothetical protein
MSTTPTTLFSPDEINGSTPTGTNSATPAPMPASGLFSPDEISQAGPSDSNDAGEDFKSTAWHDAGTKLMSGDVGGALDSIGSLFTGKNPAAVQAAQQLKDAAIGAGKTVVKGLGNIGDVATLGLTHLLPGSDKASAGINAKGTSLNTTNDDQKYGGFVGDAINYELGSQIFSSLASLPMAERLAQTANALKTLQDHPVLARIAGKALTGAGEAGTGALVATGDPEKAAEAAGIGAVAAPAISAAPDIAGSLWKTATGKAIQEELQSGVRSVASNVADDVSAQIPEGTSIRTTFENLADSVQAKSKDLYSTIDSATDGEYTNIQNKIRNVDFKLRDIAGTDDATEEKLFNQKVALNTKLDEAIDQATKNGVDPSVADQARAAWKQQSALTDLDNAVKGSTFGNAKNAPEIVDPKKLVARLQKLDDAGRLADAIGDDRANDLLQQAYDSAKAMKSRAGKVAIAKGAASLAGAGAAGGGIIHALGGK